jgi:hypothetical protein
MDMPTALEIQTEAPGGFGPGDFTIPRPEGEEGLFTVDRVKEWMYAPVEVFDEDSRQVHRSRITGNSRIGVSEIVLETEGMSQQLTDDETVRFLGIDRDLSKWDAPSVQEKVLYGTTSLVEGSTTPDKTTGAPSMELAVEDTSVAVRVCQSWYDSGGLIISAIDYAWKRGSVPNAAPWEYFVGASNDDIETSTTYSANLRAAGPGSGTLTGLGSDKKFGILFLRNTSATGAAGQQFTLYFTQVAVIGDHGLTLQGTVSTDPLTGIRGLLLSDIVEYIVTKWAPLLNIGPNSIEPTSFVIPQVAFTEDTTALELIESLVLFGGNTLYPMDWGAYDDDTFFLASPGQYGRVWNVRLDEGAESSDQGDDAKEIINGIKMEYDNGVGRTLSVGPPGSRSDYETTALQDLTTANPLNNARGVVNKWRSASMGVTSRNGAQFAAQLVMADANRRTWRGDIDIKNNVTEHKSGIEEPPYMVRALDRGIVADEPDIAERRIIQTSYNIDEGVNRVSIGAKPNRQESLFARAGIVLEGFLN